MNRNTAITIGIVLIAGAAAFYLYKKSRALPVGNVSTGNNNNGTDNQTTAGSIADAWDALSGLWS